jgi:predicted acyltransferase
MAENKQRLLSLDILRGITVAGMILVNNGYGESFEMLQHVEWNGMTPCDLVFPFFLFIMGVSTYLSLSKSGFRPSAPVIRKILRRTVLLFAIGLAINWFDHAIEGDFLCFGHLRIWAVLQRIALCYGIVSVYALLVSHKWIVPTIIALLVVYSAILIWGNGYAEDASNILARVDLSLFGYDHLYHKSPVDPEGLLGTISSVAHVLIGFYCGSLIKQRQSVKDKVLALFFLGAILAMGGYLLSYGLPLNKRIWSPSYVMVTCGMAASLLALLMTIIDIRGHRRWTTFFQVFGINPLFLYVASEFFAILFGHLGISNAVYQAIHSAIPHLQFASLGYAVSFVLFNFLLGYVLYRRRIYIKL